LHVSIIVSLSGKILLLLTITYLKSLKFEQIIIHFRNSYKRASTFFTIPIVDLHKRRENQVSLISLDNSSPLHGILEARHARRGASLNFLEHWHIHKINKFSKLKRRIYILLLQILLWGFRPLIAWSVQLVVFFLIERLDWRNGNNIWWIKLDMHFPLPLKP
jgi:hypothetical protein